MAGRRRFAAGGGQSADDDQAEITAYRCTSLQEEAADLLRLATWWPAARMFTGSGSRAVKVAQ